MLAGRIPAHQNTISIFSIPEYRIIYSVTEAGIAQLQKALPGCEISYRPSRG